MEGFLEVFNQYARSELLILVPVLYIISKLLVSSKVSNQRIPLLITVLSIMLSAVYTFATVPIIDPSTVLLALFTSVTQGILFSGASVLSGVIFNPTCFSAMLNKPNPSDQQSK